MFQIFDATSVSNNIQQENNVVARKHEQKNRKPLKEIENNKEITGKLLQTEKQRNIDKENDIKIDICSYKLIPDTFNDIMGPTDFNLRKEFKIKTPVKTVKVAEPELIDVHFNFNIDFDDILRLPEL